MCIIDCLSTIVFILPLHLDYTKVIILILWWRNFQLEYWRTFQLVSTVKEGVGKTSGTPWKSREFVIETQDQYPKRICLQVMNDNMDRFPMEEGMEVSVKFDISARELDGRYFNTLTAWDITVLNSRPSNQEGENR